MIRSALTTALALTLTAPAASAGGLKDLAKDLSRRAARSGVERVAVLPLQAGPGGGESDAWLITERLLTQLVRAGGVRAVERTQLDKVMSEHRLGRTGALDSSGVKSLGRLMAVDGIVAGSFTIDDGRVTVVARLVDVETGLIIAAEEAEFRRDWSVPSPLPGLPAGSRGLSIPAPDFSVEAPEIPAEGFLELRDAPSDGAVTCAGARERVLGLEEAVLELKARYWARRLIAGLDPSTLKANPGSSIPDSGLKRRFYDRLKQWYDFKDVPPLSPDEVRRFVALDGEAYRLVQECGI